MELKIVMVVVNLIDICTVPLNDIPHLFMVEQTDQVKEKFLKTIWHNYTFSLKLDSWDKRPTYSFFIPQCDRIYAASDNKKIMAITRSNFQDALYLVKTESEDKCSVTPINLSMESSSRITISPSGAWSTPFLPMAQCLFNPQINMCNNSETIIIANAVDASARIFLAGTEIKEKSKIDRCFEPCFISIAGKKMVFARKCPKDWAVFYNQPETRMAPELLSLTAYNIKDDYTVDDTVNLSKGWITGGSFAFDVCSTKDNMIVLATVSGLLKKPYLQIFLSPDAGVKWKEYPPIDLEEIPHRVKVTATGKRILTACTFKRHDGYHVMAAEFDR